MKLAIDYSSQREAPNNCLLGISPDGDQHSGALASVREKKPEARKHLAFIFHD